MAIASEPSTGTGNPESNTELERGLGVAGIVFLVISAAAPLGYVAGVMPVVFMASGSPAVAIHAIVVTLVLLLFSVGFSRMSRHVRNPGAFYAYIQTGLGRILGVGSATLAVLSYYLIGTASCLYLGVFTAELIGNFAGAVTPWWVWSLVSLAIVAYLGYREIELSAKVIGVTISLEVLVILIFNIAVIAQGGAEGLSAEPLLPSSLGTGSLALGMMFIITGFIGFEATAVFRAEAKNPDRTVPRATYLAVLLIGGLYVLSFWVLAVAAGVNQVVSQSAADPGGFFVTQASLYVGPILTDIIQVMLVTSLLSCVLSFHNVIARYQFTLAQRGLLPRPLGVVNRRYNAPSTSSAIVTVSFVVLTIGFVLSGLDPVAQLFAWFAGAAALGMLVLMTLTSLAVVVYYRRHRSGEEKIWQTLIAPTAASIGLGGILLYAIANFGLLTGSVASAVVIGGCLFLAFTGGCLGAAYLRSARQQQYAQLEQLD